MATDNEINMAKKYEKCKNIYKSVFIPLKNIVRNKTVLNDIIKACNMTSRLNIHCYDMIYLISLNCIENNISLPEIDKSFVLEIMRTVCSNRDNNAAEKAAYDAMMVSEIKGDAKKESKITSREKTKTDNQ
jgi:hypothetical protein